MPQVTLDGNAADTDKQHSGICQGGVTPPQPRGPMPTAGRDVTEVVCGVIRQQRYRMRRQAKNDFRQYKPVLQKGLLFRGKAKLSLGKGSSITCLTHSNCKYSV